RAMRCARVCCRAHLGCRHAQCRVGFHVPVRLLARDDRAAGCNRTQRRHTVGTSQERTMDGVGETCRRGDHAGDGTVLFREGGDGVVKPLLEGCMPASRPAASHSVGSVNFHWLAAGRLACALLLASPASGQSLVGTAAPVVTIADLDVEPVRLDAKASGKPMLIEFWATWCEVCEALLPTMREVHRKHGQRVNFIGVNVTVNESRNRVKRWVDREKPPYRTLYDESGAAVRAF